MSKKHKPPAHSSARTQLPRRALVTLQDAVWLSERHEPEHAREKLAALNKQFPHHSDILLPLMNVLYDLKDWAVFQDVAEQLVELRPDDPDILLNLAGSYATNLRPVSALYAFRKFVSTYPNHPRSAEVRATVTALENKLPEILAEAQLADQNAERIAMLHERSLALFERGEYKRARRVIDELLALQPGFVSALNNLSNLWFIEGELARAIETAQQVLQHQPDNIQALSNLTRFLCLQGHVGEAQTVADRLKTVESERTDAEVKQVEALAMLGDDADILKIFERAEESGTLKEPFAEPFLFHAAGAAAMRQGDERRAKKLWSRALEIAPTFHISRDNLDDLKKPIGERHAPWFFTLAEWVPRKTLDDLNARIRPALNRGDTALTQAMARFLRDHPELKGIIPMLLDRGDPMGREFAFRIAEQMDSPEMQAALRDFALSTRGPDNLRMQAARIAMRAGLIPSGNVRMFMQGEWLEVLLLDMEITGEPELKLKPAAQKLAEQAYDALNDGNPTRAESLLRQALTLEPDDPSLTHNLTMALEMQNRRTEAEALLRKNHARHPDYLFARTVLARLAIQKGQLAEAQELLDPLMSQKRFHISEFAAFAAAEIDFWLAKGEAKGAQSWFDMWSSVDPDNPQLNHLRRRLNPPGRFLRR